MQNLSLLHTRKLRYYKTSETNQDIRSVEAWIIKGQACLPLHISAFSQLEKLGNRDSNPD